MLPPPRVIQNVKPGQTIKMTVDGRKRTCFVNNVYPFCVNAYYLRRGKTVDVFFSLGELVQAGYEPKMKGDNREQDSEGTGKRQTRYSNRSRYYRYGSNCGAGV